MNKFKGLLILLLAALVLAACGGDTTPEKPADTPDDAVEGNASEGDEEGKVFTLEELSEFDGKDGNPAYVAVDGIVYDVSDIGVWANGEHFNGVEAGLDNTDKISASPHGESVLENLPIVGTLE